MFGKLINYPFHYDLIALGGAVTQVLGLLTIIGVLTYFKRWKWLWREWLTSLDPKKIGVMYIVVVLIMLFKGVGEAMLMRVQQVMAVGDSAGLLTSSHFQQIFTAHGTTMIFFVGMGAIFGLFNLILPLQIGARDVAFPFLNSISFWLFASGAGLLLVSLIVGEFSAVGWVAYPPLSGAEYSPGVGVDYWIWSVQISGLGSLFSGINFLVTIFTMRCPGMTLMKMPIFVWCVMGSAILIVFAFPILTATVGMLSLDRLFGMHFFTSDFGGNPMLYVNFIWAWGHPEVYILILPAFGVFSEVVATFSHKRLFGYLSMVIAIIAIVFLSFIVWLHHFFTMGSGAEINAFFGIMTMLIAVPTGVKVFNWLFTMVRGKVVFATPMLWFLGFVIIFTIGGMAGVLMSIAPVDFQVHNSLYLIAHFHAMVIGGTLFGFLSAFSYWFPKFFGFVLNEKLGKYAFYSWFIGFMLAFTPLYILGFMGATRRLDRYDAGLGWDPLFSVAALGALFILIGVGFQVLQLVVSIWQRKRDTTGDPWNGRTLEWTTRSPPPFYNFAHTPQVDTIDPFWEQKQGREPGLMAKPYEEIHMPKDSPIGMWIGLLSFFAGFGIVWHIMWLAIVSFIGIVIFLIVRLTDTHPEYVISPAEIEKMEQNHE